MKAPIVINDNPRADSSGDLCVYDSVEAAECAIEFDDASDDCLHVYDSDGRKLKIVANKDRRGAHLEDAEGQPTHSNILTAILRDFLIRLGQPKALVELMDVDRLMTTIYERNPNPYSGNKR